MGTAARDIVTIVQRAIAQSGVDMTGKPEDIPQDVMEAAEDAYQRAIYMTTSDEPQNMVLMVARAIMAATDRAIAACEAQKAIFASNEYATPQPLGGLMERFACDQCIAAIRK